MGMRQSLEASPIHRAVWNRDVDRGTFESRALELSDQVRTAMDASIDVVRRHLERDTLYGPERSISEQAIRDLAAAGYWKVPASREHGGLGGSFAATAEVIARISEVDPYVAGMLSTHACLGPVGILEAFGTPAQRARLIPPLARGERLGAFAVTEPSSSSDWSMLQCVARRDGASLLLTGEKFLITNGAPGRTVSVLCRVEGRFEMLVVELPSAEDQHFRVVRYGIKAPAHVPNVGLRFHELPVPVENVIRVPGGDGRTLAHFSLNRGRIAICGFACGFLRRIAAELIPWLQARRTFGAPIGARELVRHRLGRLAGRIVACDAMLSWAAQLHDEGHHGQLECVTTKVFASEGVKEALTDILLKTLGGRSFLEGTLFSEFVFDALAPPVYEGENEIVTLGFFRSLCRAHARALEETRTLLGEARSHPELGAVLRAGKAASSYARWSASRRLRLPLRHGSAEAHAVRTLQDASLEISTALFRWGNQIAEHHSLALEISHRIQAATTILVVSRFGARQHDPVVKAAAEALAAELTDRLTGSRSSERLRTLLADVGEAVAEGRFPLLAPESIARAAVPRMIDHLEPPPVSPAYPGAHEAAGMGIH